MARYKVVRGTLQVGPGARLELSHRQAEPRGHLLDKAGDGTFVARGVLQFKAGEELGIADASVLGKAQLGLLDPLDAAGEPQPGLLARRSRRP